MDLEDPGAGLGSGLGEADGPMRGMAFGCSGCADAGHCRWGLDQEHLASACMGRGAESGAC